MGYRPASILGRVIVCASTYRTGSALLYNAIRLICEESGEPVYARWIDHFKISEAVGGFNIIKVHKFSKNLAWLADDIFVTNRGKACTIASMKRRRAMNPPKEFRSETEWERYDEFKTSLWEWEMVNFTHVNVHKICFPRLAYNLKESVLYISVLLNVSIIADNVVDKLVNLKVPEEGYDPETYLHAGHITYEGFK